MGRHSVWLVLAMTLSLAPGVHGQTVTVAQLSGTLMDESGGALPGAEVTVTQTDTGMTRFVITNERGGFVFTGLPVGPYKLSAKMDGFSGFEQTGIVLSVGDTRSVNVTLKVGALSETVSVTGGRQPRRSARHRRQQGGRAGADRQPAAQRPGREPARSFWPAAPSRSAA